MSQPGVTILRRPAAALRLHEAATLVPPMRPDEYAELLADVKAHGVKVPLDADGDVVLDGRHRLKAALELGLREVPVRPVVLNGEGPTAYVLKAAVLRRHLTDDQRAAMAALWRQAHDGRGGNRRGGRVDSPRRCGESRPGTAESVHLFTVPRRKADEAVWLRERDPGRLAQVHRGEVALKDAVREIRRAEKAAAARGAIEQGAVDFESVFKRQLYDVWNIPALDPGYGQPWPGNIPASLVANVLDHFTERGALVVDPMAGGGVTGDVCRALGWRCVMADANPCPARDDILRHRVEDGPVPGTAGRADLVFLDPPYWTLKAEAYSADGASALSWPGWVRWLRVLARTAAATARPGGGVAILMQDNVTRDVAPGECAKPSILETALAMLAAGLRPAMFIGAPYPTQQASAQDVEWARRNRRMLGINRVLMVFRKRTKAGSSDTALPITRASVDLRPGLEPEA